ncbi:type I restriction enzyme HsdR N-terminal domain-containing protein [Salinibacter altiplanensis]|uniref:type I restriction enzyme HsdR N-terminal domain-containing protein n=1 Tax=Salinibacter altiplanensis TaxID=1803181 RepID=UPI000C9EDE74|nr:type I restriction enzyme HsdR N-terminal domain-containing protein [Salinibacter altiplanensis]
MDALNLPTYEFRTRTRDDAQTIYDPLRDRYVRLTPEEWVRQHFVQYLTQELGVPAGLVAVEAAFQFQGQPRRADVIVHDRQGDPLLLVECKAPRVSLTQDAFDQCARYNIVLQAPYLVVTNGQTHYACAIDFDDQSYAFLDDLPPYDALLDTKDRS